MHSSPETFLITILLKVYMGHIWIASEYRSHKAYTLCMKYKQPEEQKHTIKIGMKHTLFASKYAICSGYI